VNLAVLTSEGEFSRSEEVSMPKSESEKPAVTLPGTVEKIIPANIVGPEKVQISIEGAEDLYRELRVENTLQDEKGKEVALKPGAHVEVTVEADKNATVPKK
jgi:hypothetical protein